MYKAAPTVNLRTMVLATLEHNNPKRCKMESAEVWESAEAAQLPPGRELLALAMTETAAARADFFPARDICLDLPFAFAFALALAPGPADVLLPRPFPLPLGLIPILLNACDRVSPLALAFASSSVR